MVVLTLEKCLRHALQLHGPHTTVIFFLILIFFIFVFLIFQLNERCDGVVVQTSVPQSLDLGLIPLSSCIKDFKNNIYKLQFGNTGATCKVKYSAELGLS